MTELLRLEKIVKSFSGVTVLKSVNLTLNSGEVVALLGENGAGKSTLMNIVMGILAPDSGHIYLSGKSVKIGSPTDAHSMGIAMIHQELTPIPDMTVAENIYLGREPRRYGLVSMRRQNEMTKKLLDKLGLDIPVTTKMRDLSVSQIQIVEIAKALSYNAKIIIMDEPTSSITEENSDKLFDIINQLIKQEIGVIYISHKLDEIEKIASRVVILRDGEVVRTANAGEITKNEMISAMVGHRLKDIYPKCDNKAGDVVFEVRGFSKRGKFRDISFKLYAGEKLGIGGLMGAGRSEVLAALFGADKVDSGQVFLNGREISIRNPAKAIKYNFAYVPEDRKIDGLNLLMSISENATMYVDRKIAAFGIRRRKREKQAADGVVRKYSIRCGSSSDNVGKLSGGNQQKVVLGKCMLSDPNIIFLDEPTRGIDVGAKAEIFSIMNNLVMQGKSVVFVSSEMQELVGVADRVLVMCEGRIAGELSGDEITQKNIMYLASPMKNQDRTTEL